MYVKATDASELQVQKHNFLTQYETEHVFRKFRQSYLKYDISINLTESTVKFTCKPVMFCKVDSQEHTKISEKVYSSCDDLQILLAMMCDRTSWVSL